MSAPTSLRDPASVTVRGRSATSHRGGDTRARDWRDAVDPHLVSLLSPRSFEADQYRILRHFLHQVHGPDSRKVVAVTSPTAGDGKTTTAVNLAATLGQMPSARVLLMDTDLRRPLVADSLGLDQGNGPGLAATALEPHLELDDVVRPTPFNFDIVPAGEPTPNACRLFDSPRVGQLLDQARQKYDHVVLDTPPVLLVPDCRLMSQWVDGFLFVVSAHRTPRKLLTDALDALDPEKILGIVFNADERPLAGYFGRYQGYYGYHQRSANSHRWWRFPWRRAAQRRSRPWL
jgi:capsular exopolysaccharide synthesis family protein